MTMLGRTVIYRSKTGDYSLAAIVIADGASINPLGVERRQVPALTGPDHVHLTVLTPGLPPAATPEHTAQIIDTRRPLGQRQIPPMEPIGDELHRLEDGQFIGMTQFGSTYAEFDIPWWRRPGILGDLSDTEVAARIMDGHHLFEPGRWDLADQPAGTWTLR